MRLRDLDARFVDRVTATSSHNMDGDSVVGAQGVRFQCPSCGAGLEAVVDHERTRGGRARRYLVGAHYIEVLFNNPQGAPLPPADAGPRVPKTGEHPRWRIVSGSTLDDLTLDPSINCDLPSEDGTPSICKFHGYVKNGNAE